MKHISFITTIKICEGYEFLVDRINVYILNIQKYCEKYDISYEILICEQINEKNIYLIGDKLINQKNVILIKLEQRYFNPFNYNLIESYGKNACLKEANSKFTCMTSADQIFSEAFFVYVKGLQLNSFYRFATFEIPEIDVSPIYKDPTEIDGILETCFSQTEKRLCNPSCFDSNITPIKLGQKAGDIMVLDTESFRRIGGWPENECYLHVDTTVCAIIYKKGLDIIIPKPNICSYTMRQTRRDNGNKTLQYVYVFCDAVTIHLVYAGFPGAQIIDHEQYQWLKCCRYIV
jgi:hypothetical protein